MPYKNTFDVPPKTMLCVTPTGPFSRLRLQNQGDYRLHVMPHNSGALPGPANTLGSVVYEVLGGFDQNTDLNDLWPNEVAVGASVFIWVYSDRDGKVSVSTDA